MPDPDVPILDSLAAAINDDGAIAIQFEGRTGVHVARTIHLELLDGAGNAIAQTSGWASWHVRMNRIYGSGSSGHLAQVGRNFSGFMSYWSTELTARPERVRVTIDDIEENPGVPVEAELGAPSPVPVGEGELCDPHGILNLCPEGAFCDTIDDVYARVAPTCHTPDPVCPIDTPSLDGTVRASNEEARDATSASCTSSRGNLGNEQGHVFVAEKSGAHRFRAEEVDAGSDVVSTLFVRRYCDFGSALGSELGCAHISDFPAGEPVELGVELEAGQTVYVFVEASWVRGGEYVLSVQEPD